MGFPSTITRDGNAEVRIYSFNAGGTRPIHGAWKSKDSGCWIPMSWTKGGYASKPGYPRALDIVLPLKDENGTSPNKSKPNPSNDPAPEVA